MTDTELTELAKTKESTKLAEPVAEVTEDVQVGSEEVSLPLQLENTENGTTDDTIKAGTSIRKQAAKERQERQKYEKSEFVAMLDENGVPIPKSERKPKRKCAVMIGYCGTGYNGLQIQSDPNVKTIERDLYEAMYKAGAISFENSVDLKKSGFQRSARTDKGVHAAGNVVSLKLIIEDPEIRHKINQYLPQQIRIWGIQRTTKGFDCRKMCSSRVYEYLLPTYSLLSPKPKTRLFQLIEENKSKHPELFMDDDGEGTKWWKEVVQKIIYSGITQEQLDSLASIQEEGDPPTSESTIVSETIKKIKQIENQARRSYRISSKRLDHFTKTMQQYEGTHNFHNFTIGKPYKDTSSNRFIISTKISSPFVIDGTEWISIKLHGQSFMLHQIRKMISMASLIVRCDLPPGQIISNCFKPTRINIPKAPALGLLLENPVFDAYNVKLKDHSYEPIDFSKYEKEMLDFKMKNIYDKIYMSEVKDNTFYGFFGYIDTFRVPEDEANSSQSTSIFDFLVNYIEDETKTRGG
ncbi:PUS1 [Candida oxycetoniae]|uniref:tRNA pseudouridine synthase 1 n=1 Tax=Candida oxycetoniae TaxID=497107 RepID=A0AAI9WWB2_9ASCO|nr:PUS1 [Candida oxycetoniae]KAI3403040.2 PUS1 [Candida oxycetoniae]